MLFSSIGFSMDIHFCGNEIESIGLYGKADECEMMKKLEQKQEKHACCSSSQPKKATHCSNNSPENDIKKGKCCQNEIFSLQSLNDFSISNAFYLSSTDCSFAVVYIYNIQFNLETKRELNPLDDYSPPLLNQDVTILHQVFLI